MHPVDVSGPEIAFGEPWSLFDASDRAESWRIGGLQHLAVHATTGRLYSLVHRGGPDGHKEPGEEVWVYDVAERRRLQRIGLVSPGFSYLGFPIEPAPDSFWYGVWYWLLDHLAPPLVTQIQVTPDPDPLLFAAAQATGSVVVYDAQTGELLRRIQAVGFTTGELNAPWAGGR
jgi:methylamine dehydrogenase heavy chain